MKRLYLLVISLSAIFLVAILGTQPAWSKGHVPLKKVQVCHVEEGFDITSTNGVAITVSENALAAHLAHGDCQLPACDFNNVFHTGDLCNRQPSDECPLSLPRNDAGGATPGCPPGTF